MAFLRSIIATILLAVLFPILVFAHDFVVSKDDCSEQLQRRLQQLLPPTNCTETYFEQRMDHFGPSPGTFQQRYFVSDIHHNKNGNAGGPMFFYLGNEADVTLYVNNTGLIWENAEEFGALVVFAEHRYYGKSELFPDDQTHAPRSTKFAAANFTNLRYLSSDQALMDYATLVMHLKKQHNLKDSDAVIAFGGSYGGMLASWARIQYPHVWDGAIAASAPILAFEGMEGFLSDPGFFTKGLEYDVSIKGGIPSDSFCGANLQKVFGNEKALLGLDPALMRSKLKLCEDDRTTDDDLGENAANWLNDALAYLSMGNYPYPSGYILNGGGVLPAFPVRVACELLSEDLTDADRLGDWLAGLVSFAGVYYNYTGALPCNRLSSPAANNASSIVDALWNYQYCSELFMVGGQGPDRYDVYWDEPWDGTAAEERCQKTYGFVPDHHHVALSYGTPRDWARDNAASNIVWSQGEYDPWKGGGILKDLSDSLIALVIPEAAHHLDLFFSHPCDTEEVVATRLREVGEIRRWIQEKKQQQQQRGPENKSTIW